MKLLEIWPLKEAQNAVFKVKNKPIGIHPDLDTLI